MQGQGVGRVMFGPDRTFNGVRVFSATMVAGREQLGEEITQWLANNPQIELREIIVTQSSDNAFHCVSLTVLFWEHLD